MPRRPLGDRVVNRAQATARALILDAALPRLLRLAADPDAEANSLLAAARRRLDEFGRKNPDVDEADAVAAHARQIVSSALGAERQRRLAELGTDGTP